MACEIGVLFATPPSISSTVLPRHGRQHGGDGGAGDHRLEERAGGEQQLFAGDHVNRDDVQRDRQVLEQLGVEVLGDEPSQAGVGHEVGAGAEEAEQAAEGLIGKIWPRLTWRQIAGEVVGGLGGLLRLAMNAPLIAPAEVATIRSGSMPRS